MRHFNRRSRDYQFSDKIEAGLVLSGSEVKSLRTQPAHFQNSQIILPHSQPQIIGLDIPPYRYSSDQQTDTTRPRRLLLSSAQINKLKSYKNQKYTLVPIAIYPKGKWFKLEIGIGRKLKKYEKRAKLKTKEFKSQLSRYPHLKK